MVSLALCTIFRSQRQLRGGSEGYLKGRVKLLSGTPIEFAIFQQECGRNPQDPGSPPVLWASFGTGQSVALPGQKSLPRSVWKTAKLLRRMETRRTDRRRFDTLCRGRCLSNEGTSPSMP